MSDLRSLYTGIGRREIPNSADDSSRSNPLLWREITEKAKERFFFRVRGFKEQINYVGMIFSPDRLFDIDLLEQDRPFLALSIYIKSRISLDESKTRKAQSLVESNRYQERQSPSKYHAIHIPKAENKCQFVRDVAFDLNHLKRTTRVEV